MLYSTHPGGATLRLNPLDRRAIIDGVDLELETEDGKLILSTTHRISDYVELLPVPDVPDPRAFPTYGAVVSVHTKYGQMRICPFFGMARDQTEMEADAVASVKADMGDVDGWQFFSASDVAYPDLVGTMFAQFIQQAHDRRESQGGGTNAAAGQSGREEAGPHEAGAGDAHPPVATGDVGEASGGAVEHS